MREGSVKNYLSGVSNILGCLCGEADLLASHLSPPWVTTASLIYSPVTTYMLTFG